MSVSVREEELVAIADDGNNRVMIWNTIPTGGQSANRAQKQLGQVDFDSNSPNRNNRDTPGNNTFNGPSALFINTVHTVVADTHNNRILRFDPQ